MSLIIVADDLIVLEASVDVHKRIDLGEQLRESLPVHAAFALRRQCREAVVDRLLDRLGHGFAGTRGQLPDLLLDALGADRNRHRRLRMPDRPPLPVPM